MKPYVTYVVLIMIIWDQSGPQEANGIIYMRPTVTIMSEIKTLQDNWDHL